MFLGKQLLLNFVKKTCFKTLLSADVLIIYKFYDVILAMNVKKTC